MASSLSALVVSLGLDATEFVSGLTKAEREAKAFQEGVKHHLEGVGKTVEGLKHVLEGLGVALGVHEIIEWGKSVVEAAENLNNLSVETGSTVEALSRLQNIAKVSGTDFEKFHTVMDRLAAGISGTEDATTRTGATLKYLGITARDPATAMQQLAEKFAEYADGANKAGLARDLFGKDGVKFLTVLKAIAEEQRVGTTTTREQAEAAQKLAEQMRVLQVNSTQLKDVFLNDVVPALSTLVQKMLDASVASGGLLKGIGNLLTIGLGGDKLQNMQKAREEVEKLETQIASLKKAGEEDADKPLLRSWTKIGYTGFNTDALEKDLAGAKVRLEITKKQFGHELDFLDEDAKNRHAKTLPDAPKPLGPLGTGAVDDPGKKILEERLKTLDASIEREKKMLQTRQEYIDAYYAQGYISVKNYYDRRDESTAEGLAFDRKALEEEISILQARIALPTSKKGEGGITETDRADARIKLIEVTKRLSNVEAEAQKAGVLGAIQRKVATQEYIDQLGEVNARTLELAGNTADAARIRTEASTRIQIRKFENSGDFAAADQVRALNQQQIVQAGLNDETKKYSNLIERNSIAQERLALLQQNGAVSELDALQRQSDANKALIPLLQARADAAALLAAQSKDPADVLKVERLRLEIEKLGSQTDLVADRFNKIFADSFTSAFDGVIDGTKSVSGAFRDMEKSIVQSINKIASQMIADSLFGKDSGIFKGLGTTISGFLKDNSVTGKGSGTGAGFGMNDRGLGEASAGGAADFLSKLFGGDDKKSVLAATTADAALSTLSVTTGTTDAALVAMTTATSGLDLAFGTLVEAATSAAAALSSVGAGAGGGGIGGIGGLFGGGGAGEFGSAYDAASALGYAPFAGGGDPPVGRPSLVGEHGPELFVPKSAGTILPHGTGIGGKTVNISGGITINVPTGTSRASASQIASAAGVEIARQVRRNT